MNSLSYSPKLRIGAEGMKLASILHLPNGHTGEDVNQRRLSLNRAQRMTIANRSDANFVIF